MTSKHQGRRSFPTMCGRLLAACALGLPPLGAMGAAIPEPSTVFYGRITGTGSAQPFPITEGTLEWVIETASGRNLRLTAPIRPVRDSGFAYRLNVPHHALALGLASDGLSVPLKAATEAHRHLEVKVNGLRAILSGPTGDSFDAAQVRRAATYQLDLEVPVTPEDRDGDGLPDWWQTQHHLTGGASGDADGDGVSNAEEYRLGTNPNRSNRQPTLRTSTLLAYADGTTGVALDVVDSDTAPASLVYQLVRPPAVGELRLRNEGAAPSAERVLPVQGSFTQADVLGGRLVYVHPGGALGPTTFELIVSDSTAAHPMLAATVEVRPFRPVNVGAPGEPPLPVLPAGVELVSSGTTSLAEQRVQNYLLSRDAGFVVWDWSAGSSGIHFQAPSATSTGDAYLGTYVAQFGRDRGHVLMGGSGANILEGGMESDVLIAGSTQNALRGNAGADRFVVGWVQGGSDRIEDFSPEQGDVLDLSRILSGSSALLSDYVRAKADGGDVVLEIDADGVGARYVDRQVRLSGFAPASLDLTAWLDEGRLVTGGIGLPPRVSIATARAQTGEAESEPGVFVLTRTGPDTTELVVSLAIGGSAVNGTDYSTVAPRAVFRSGDRNVRIAIQPFADSQPEPAETVELIVLAGSGYTVGGADRAHVTIADWQSTLSLVAIEPFATLQPLRSGLVRITSSAPVDRPVEVLLSIGGSAEPGVHYQPLRRLVTLAAGQSSATLEVAPLSGAVLPGGAASVEIRIVPDPAYGVGAGGAARVMLVDRLESFAAWRSRHFPNDRDSLAAFGARDPGGLGVPLIARYAFGLDPFQPDATRVPRPHLRDGYLTLDFPRRPAASDLEFVVEVSSDLVTWEASSARVQEVRLLGADSDPAMLSYRAVPGIREASRQFMRVRIVHRP